MKKKSKQPSEDKSSNSRAVRAIKVILIILGILLLADAAVMAFVVNFNAGILFTALLGAAFAVTGSLFDRMVKIKWLTVGFAAACLLLASLLTFIAVYGQSDNADHTEDAVIVLGAGIHGDKVSVQLAHRLDAAVGYCRKNPQAVVVVSGGQGPDEDITEALAMERYLIERGVPAGRILKEELSTSTHTNLYNSKAILDRFFEDDYKVTVITSSYHIYRAVSVARALGLDCTHVHSDIMWYSLPISFLRECAAVIRLWIFGAK